MKAECRIEDVVAALKAGERVLMMTRHAERPHIDPEDPTFGENLPITDGGVVMARGVGERLRPAADMASVQFLASPLRRTRMTAAAIADGMGLASKWNIDTIPTDVLIGNSSPYYSDPHEAWEIFRGGEFYRLMFEYCETGRQRGFRPIDEATDMVEALVMSRFTAQFGVFTTHDLFIAAFLTSRRIYRGWTVPTWIQYLDSAAIFIAPDGSRRYALVRA